MSNPFANQRQDEETVREAVRERYGTIARRELAEHTRPAGGCGPARAGELIAVIDDVAEAGCCAPDGTSEAQIEAVKAFYQASDTSALPASVTALALGCGNPTAIAELAPGETVLDLGSGGGIDCFLAAQRVGPGGRVIGVDMTEEMITLARGNAAKVGATNVEFRRGQIEALPVEDESVDVLISNCVINLSPDKPRVLREAYRVLKPGGRLRVSDVVLTKELDVVESEYLSEWADCIAGALRPDEFARQLEAAGFVDVRVAIGEGGTIACARPTSPLASSRRGQRLRYPRRGWSAKGPVLPAERIKERYGTADARARAAGPAPATGRDRILRRGAGGSAEIR